MTEQQPPSRAEPPDAAITPCGRGCAELRVQRSRFVGWVDHAADEASARSVVAEAARIHHDAHHVCWAWRLGLGPEPQEQRADAGEPAGTAGEPILVALRAAGLVACVGVVIRWFGGIKLGTGGLARAYGQAAREAAAAAPRREILRGRRFTVDLAYPQLKTVRHLLATHGGRVLAENYGTAVTWTLWLPHSRWRAFVRAVTETTAGGVRPRALPGESEP